MERLLVSKLMTSKRLTTIKSKKDKQLKDWGSINVNEEYQGALKSKYFADFFSKAQVIVHNPSLSGTQSYCHKRLLLEPDQETISKVLECITLSKNSDLKDLILDYFDISSEGSNICTTLLKSTIQIQSRYESTRRMDIVVDNYPRQTDGVISYSKLSDLIINPVSNITKIDFEVICSKYSTALQKMKVDRIKVARKMKLISIFNKASVICITAACGVVAVAAMALAAHTLTALVMGPAILSLPLKILKKKLGNFKFFKSKFLRRVGDQLDVAIKGTYILNRDFDTMSRLGNCLHDDIERKKRMMELCFKRGHVEDKVCFQVLRELEKSDAWFRKQVEEVEKHVYLCLLKNRYQSLVMKFFNM